MKTKYDYIVGIDPDIERIGVAFLCVKSRILQLTDMPLPELLKAVPAYVDRYAREEPPLSLDPTVKVAVVVEIDRLHTGNWHLTQYDTKRSAASKGFDQGRCFHTAEAICDILRYEGIEVIEKAPLVKMWSGPDRKITHEELTSLQGINFMFKTNRHKSNQEQRDAALLALDLSDIPLILPPKKRKDRQIKTF